MISYLNKLPIKSEITNWSHHTIYINSGNDEYPGCALHIAWGFKRWTIDLPPIIKPHRELHIFKKSWEENKIGYYTDILDRQYGISYHEEFISINYGKVTHDSSTDMHKSFLIPWLDKRVVRTTIINPLDMSIHHPNTWHIKGSKRWEEQQEIENSCPKFEFAVMHTDGHIVKGRLHLEEWEWRQGSGHFKWLGHIIKPKIILRMDVTFDDEVGKGRGSWKGGTLGLCTHIESGQTYIDRLREYCIENHLILLIDDETGAQGLEP